MGIQTAIITARKTKEYRVQSLAELNYILSCKILTDAEFRLWEGMSVVTSFDNNLTAEINYRDLARIVSKSIRTVQRLIASLVQKGFLIIRSISGVGNQITLSLPEEGHRAINQAANRLKKVADNSVVHAVFNQEATAPKGMPFSSTPDKVDVGTHVKVGAPLKSIISEINNKNIESVSENFTCEEFSALTPNVQIVDFMKKEIEEEKTMETHENAEGTALLARYKAFFNAANHRGLTPLKAGFQKELRDNFSEQELWQVNKMLSKQDAKLVKHMADQPRDSMKEAGNGVVELKTTAEPAMADDPNEVRLYQKVKINGIKGTLLVEKELYDTAVNEMQRMYHYRDVHPNLMEQSFEQLLDSVLYHIACSSLNSSQKHRYFAAKKMIKEGRFGTPTQLAKSQSIQREMNSAKEKAEFARILNSGSIKSAIGL